MSLPREDPKYLLLGEVLRPHGVRGELRIRILTDHPERIRELEQVYLGAGPNDVQPQVYHVEGLRLNPPHGLLKLKGIDDRDTADRLRSLFVMVDLAHAVPLEEGEFYLYQLIGVTVQTDTGDVLGTIKDVLETGANDVYVIDSPQYGEVLIPVTDETIVRTDIESGLVIVHLLDGLLPSS